ncbi:related to glu/asp-tRNA amidotransferase subunit A [Phialocephala subalpina]|uniref:Related to glu/asp-tRNA amidotransferase subunit A n=1 Tax=Phialocephala subalpina TaxID=576137 RepID=A0A1L7X6J3_9HELO|nr:related to glu/asp-tRNA amidotransferase subunit A [Phialocephala subalpina]
MPSRKLWVALPLIFASFCSIRTPSAAYSASSLAEGQTLASPFPYQFPVFQDGPSADETDFPIPLCNNFKLEEASIDQLQDAMSDGKLTSVQIVECYLQRVHQVDQYLRAIMEINPDALSISASLDLERTQGHIRGPLHGIPFLAKDNIATKDKMETTAGSWALLGSIVPRDAYVVHKLRQTGAVLMGHAAMSEWADMRSNLYSEGYSPRGGQCRSPYNFTVNPGGSSSGSAVAVTANMVTFSLGTETDGSITNPADRNALVGIKPTLGLTSRDGTIPSSHNLDTIGCFARTVRDATYCLDAIYGPDPDDNYTLNQVTPLHGYTPFLATSSVLKDAKFGIPWLSFWQYASPSQKSHLSSFLSLIESAGATIINNTELPSRNQIIPPYGWDWDYGSVRGYPNESTYTVAKVDFYNDIGRYLSELNNSDIRSLEDIVRYNVENVGEEGGIPGVHPAFKSGQDGFLASMVAKGVMDETYWQALSYIRRMSREEGIDAALFNKGDRLDALLVPSDVRQGYNVAAMAGYPVVTIPGGINATSAMPYGLALMGTAWSEGELIKLASAIEDVARGTVFDRQSVWMKPRWWGYRRKNVPVEEF